jgi:hypothetical protein
VTPNRHAEIAKRAHAIWELEGRPSGRDLNHWFRAEAEFDATQRAQITKEGPAKRRRPKAKRDRSTL